jgi:hypothetical protein
MAKQRVRFEKCDCGSDGGPHGYFYDDEKGKTPIPTMSMEVGKSSLEFFRQERGLSPEEVAEVEGQLAGAGLRENASEEEKELIRLAAMAAETGIPLEFLLALV